MKYIKFKSRIIQLTHALFGQVKEVDELPVLAEGVVRHVLGALENVALGAREVHVVQLQ
jgi:hypothetical protein